MSESEILRVTTFHKTQVFVDVDRKLIHKVAGSNELPLYARRIDGGAVSLFVMNEGATDYVTRINADCTVEIGSAPAPIDFIINADGTFTVKFGAKFLSARKTGTFSLMPKNLSWEHLTLSTAHFINGSEENIFTARTVHKTNVLLDADDNLVHKRNAESNDRPVYVHQQSDGVLSFFVIERNTPMYIRTINTRGRVVLSYEPVPFKTIHNDLDGSLTIFQNGECLSAVKETGRFTLVPRNQAWEHYFLDNVTMLDSGKRDAILIVMDDARLDDVIARLNFEQINLRSVLINGKTDEYLTALSSEKKLPLVSMARLEKTLLDARESLWLLSGGSGDELRKISEHLQSRGVPRGLIVNIESKMPVTPTWSANIKSAEVGDYDFIVTGDLSTAVGIDVERIFNRKGINLAADGQDLRQSYLTAKHVLARNRSIRAVLIGLTPDMLSDSESRYVFDDGEASLNGKFLRRLFKDEVPPADVNADPNLTALKSSMAQGYSLTQGLETADRISFGAMLNNLRQLEEYIRLCLEHGAKPVGILLPTSEIDDGRELIRHVARNLEQCYEFPLIDLMELPLNQSQFSNERCLNLKGSKLVGDVLNYQIHERGVFPIEEMRLMNYERLSSLRDLIGVSNYNTMMDRLFAASIDVIRRKDKVKVGFVLFDASMWCGDRLYNLFADNERYEPTIFLSMRRDEKHALVKQNYNRSLELLTSKNRNLVKVLKDSDRIPKQDVLIYLTPYYSHLKRGFAPSRLTAETLVTYMPYSIGVGLWGVNYFPIYMILWKMFVAKKASFHALINKKWFSTSRAVFSGHPKTDIFFSSDAVEFDWKMTKPDALKIIWAPHWSIKGLGNVLKLATFQWNYNFMYEYAKAHPEISWVLKPHPNLAFAAIDDGVFASAKESAAYFKKWDELPNARVVMGEYYQSIFATSDGMILDSSSFTVEYQFTHKPLLFLTRSTTKLNEVGQKVIEANYHVDGKDFDGIKHFIDDVLINKNDPQAQARQKVFDEELNYFKDNGMLASDMVFKTIDEALSK